MDATDPNLTSILRDMNTNCSNRYNERDDLQRILNSDFSCYRTLVCPTVRYGLPFTSPRSSSTRRNASKGTRPRMRCTHSSWCIPFSRWCSLSSSIPCITSVWELALSDVHREQSAKTCTCTAARTTDPNLNLTC